MRHVLIYLASVIALANVQECAGIVCFYCTIQPPSRGSNQTAQLCSKFDGSNNYHIDCPHSTLCMKRTFHHSLQGGKTIQVSERGCAPQKRNIHFYQDGNWRMENKIEEDVYNVGCQNDEGLGMRSPTEYCYCATNLCNSGDKSRDHADTMAVIIIFNLLKYIQSLR
ncbi:uncharacterized protein LOC128997984 [Macrosteles quadrilineatus]|uniref:uncharacterized protein LOC128997958 n=1 Tax=Macrosteles quadrilineatus TaxID=74068 RepID=UPI0023E0CE41|nr:uncharacterized protein LOC128997958 [Macrosteles quadrilineatus]XP_054279847.1 uncharacterized protein LOC128997984 [Macrosteles quadrilineatus]